MADEVGEFKWSREGGELSVDPYRHWFTSDVQRDKMEHELFGKKNTISLQNQSDLGARSSEGRHQILDSQWFQTRTAFFFYDTASATYPSY
jgi:hypothetical protein